MSKINTAVRLLKCDRGAFMSSIIQYFFNWLPDKPYLKLLYRYQMGHRLDLKNPQAFTEKIQWLKLHSRRPVYTTMVDKYAVKKYVANIIGEEYIIPTLGVWDKPEDIDWKSLPLQFVLKTTHGGGGSGVIICKDKVKFNKEGAIAKLAQSLKSDIYRSLREWPYKNVPKRIIAEKYIASDDNQTNVDLYDYKFFCFNGKVRFFKVDFGRFVEHHANYYSPEGTFLEFGEQACHPEPNYTIAPPYNLNDMISLAEKLSVGVPFLRVDFYNLNGKIYFGELTFYPASGLGKFEPETADYQIGKYLTI